jgi:hypothetical protein
MSAIEGWQEGRFMKRGDFLWMAAIAAIGVVLAIPSGREIFLGATRAHPLLMAFAKFAVLATLGELLGLRLQLGKWKQPAGFFWRVIVWGTMGVTVALTFTVFSTGVHALIALGYLPVGSGALRTFAEAFWISTVMNLVFGPTMMLGHRFCDAYIELTGGKVFANRVPFSAVVAHIDWHIFFGFVVAKTIPFFWIPAHTVTFLTPPEYRVLVAASLSIVLGLILAFAARSHRVDPAEATAL